MTLALPPDTDTPGYANENKNKPIETLLISETAKLFSPEEVGRKILQDSLVTLKYDQFFIFYHVYTFNILIYNI